MFSNIISYSYSDKKYNEDAYSYSDTHLLVIDGATGLGKNYMSEDDAHWYVNALCNEITKHINDSLSLVDIVKNAVNVAIQSHTHLNELQAIDMPSACISLFRINKDSLEYFGTGDSVGVIEDTNGNISIFTDKNLERLDQEVKDEMLEISKRENVSFLDTRNYECINQHLIDNRNLRNKENGYYNLDLSLDWLGHERYKTFHLKDVKRIASMSDGFEEILEYNLYSSMKDVLDTIEKDHTFIEKQLYDIQEKDKDCIICPRFKLRDDTTYIYANVKQEI